MPTLSSQSTGAGCAGEPSPYDNAIDYVLAAVAHGLPLEACQPVSCWTILWAARGGVGFLLGSLRCHPARAERLRCYCWPLSPPLKRKKRGIFTDPWAVTQAMNSACWWANPPSKSTINHTAASGTSTPLYPFSLPLANGTSWPRLTSTGELQGPGDLLMV